VFKTKPRRANNGLMFSSVIIDENSDNLGVGRC